MRTGSSVWHPGFALRQCLVKAHTFCSSTRLTILTKCSASWANRSTFRLLGCINRYGAAQTPSIASCGRSQRLACRGRHKQHVLRKGRRDHGGRARYWTKRRNAICRCRCSRYGGRSGQRYRKCDGSRSASTRTFSCVCPVIPCTPAYTRLIHQEDCDV